MTLEARASLSMNGGWKGRADSGWYLQLILVGWDTALGGITSRIPQCLGKKKFIALNVTSG